MLHSSSESLGVGLKEHCMRLNGLHGSSYSFMMGYLLIVVATLIEGDALSKKQEREALKKLIGRGRCLLNARDEQAKAERIQARLLLTKSDGGAP